MEKLTLDFRIIHQSIWLEKKLRIVSGSKNFVEARFIFSNEWNDLTKTAIFKRGESVFHVILEDNRCMVPYEVMKDSGEFSVSIFAGDLITADSVPVIVIQSGYEDGGEPLPPTPTVYEQIIKMLEEIEEGDIPQEKIDKAVEEYLSTHPVQGITEEQCKEIIRDYILSHHSELKGDTGPQGPKGDPGEPGPAGRDGVDGAQGPKGDPGEKGADGKDGEQGPRGADGAPGPAGKDGVDGAPGTDGDSAYTVAVNNGFIGTEEQWLESLKGKDGASGVAVSETEPTDPNVIIWINPNGSPDSIVTTSEMEAYVAEAIRRALGGDPIIPPEPDDPDEPDIDPEPMFLLAGDVNNTSVWKGIKSVSINSVPQGSCITPDYMYVFTSSTNRYAWKINRETWEATRFTQPEGLGHANGATYCPEDGHIYIIIAADRNDQQGIANYDPETNSFTVIPYGEILDAEGNIIIPIGIAYDEIHERFILRHIDSESKSYIDTFNLDWECLSSVEFTESQFKTGTGQNMCTDGTYLYVLRSKVNNTANYNEARAFRLSDGKFTQTINLASTEVEDMSYDFNTGKFYITYYSPNNVHIQELVVHPDTDFLPQTYLNNAGFQVASGIATIVSRNGSVVQAVPVEAGEIYDTDCYVSDVNFRFFTPDFKVGATSDAYKVPFTAPSDGWLGLGELNVGIPRKMAMYKVGEERPTIPDGYWQFKETTPYKYFILGTDDSTSSDPYFYRLLRSYGFPYTCNVIADYMDRRMDNDVIEGFTSDDAPALFTSAPTTREFLDFCKDRDDIEFALHGTSVEHLLDTRKLTDELWTTYYNDYISNGGTKTLSEFKDSVIEAVSDYDIAQGAPYIERSRNEIEEVIGKHVDTCGIWGGNASATIDGIEVIMSALDSKEYDWKDNGYSALGYYLVGKFTPSYSQRPNEEYPYRLQRDSGGIGDFVENYNLMNVGDCVELFHHFTDSSNIATHKQQLATIKQYVDEGKAKVVTRKDYISLGEYVNNPITSISATRKSNTVNVGDTDSKSEYTVVATYLDGTTQNVLDEAIVEVIADTSEAKIVKVGCYYRGFSDFVSVEVKGDSSNILEATIFNRLKIQSTAEPYSLDAASTASNVYRYDVSGLSTIWVNSTKNKQYVVCWSAEPKGEQGDTFDISTKTYYNPSNNPIEVAVPEGMNYYYIFATSSTDISDPWTVTKVPIN